MLIAPSLASALDLPVKKVKSIGPIKLERRSASPISSRRKIMYCFSPRKTSSPSLEKNQEEASFEGHKSTRNIKPEEQLITFNNKSYKSPDPVLRGFNKKWRLDEITPDLDKTRERFQITQENMESFAQSANVFFTEAEKKNRGAVLEKLREFKRVPNFSKMMDRTKSPRYYALKMEDSSLMTLNLDKVAGYRIKSPPRTPRFDNYMERPDDIFTQTDKVTKDLDYHDQLLSYYEQKSGFCLLNYAKQKIQRFNYVTRKNKAKDKDKQNKEVTGWDLNESFFKFCKNNGEKPTIKFKNQTGRERLTSCQMRVTPNFLNFLVKCPETKSK